MTVLYGFHNLYVGKCIALLRLHVYVFCSFYQNPKNTNLPKRWEVEKYEVVKIRSDQKLPDCCRKSARISISTARKVIKMDLSPSKSTPMDQNDVKKDKTEDTLTQKQSGSKTYELPW